MPRPTPQNPDDRTPGDLHEVLGVVAAELADLKDRIDGLQHLIGDLADLAGSALNRDFIIRLQDVDGVSQRLQALERLTLAMQQAAPGDPWPEPPGQDLLDALAKLHGAGGRR
ncbi:MAG: hypothetical protein HY859_08415 [Caulobacterales bacterium]|nr:hypothetical protein [Caulobacterales bacterium]